MAIYVAKASKIQRAGVDIPQVESITPPQMEMGDIDIVHLGSAYHLHRPTKVVNPGEASFVLLWDPDDAQHDLLWADYEGTVTSAYKIHLSVGAAPTLDVCTFNAFISTFGPEEITVDGVVKLPVTLTLTAIATWAAT